MTDTGAEKTIAGSERETARRAQILRAAAAVFARQGYQGARMDDIVKESGLSKGALYWYFRSKEELAVEVVHHSLRREELGMEAALAQDAPALIRLERLARTFAREMAQSPERAHLALELLALAQRIPEIKDCFARHHESYIAQLATLLRQVSGGAATDEAIVAAARAVAGAVDGVVLRWTLSPVAFDLEQQLWEVVLAVVHGLPGRE